MSTAIAQHNGAQALDAASIEQVLLGGDLSKLNPAQRLAYYKSVCESLGLNPLTKPFAYLTLSGKTVLYALKDCTEQLRNNKDISVAIKAREVVEGCYIVTAQARMPSGREDESIGAVPIDTLKGEARANACMKAETKAKRRVTLSICGLGMLDESEISSIPGAKTEEPTLVVEAQPMTMHLPPDMTDERAKEVMSEVIASSIPEGSVRLMRVEQRETDGGKAFWKITDHNHKTYTEWDQRRAAIAEQYTQTGTPVFLKARTSEKWGDVVKDIKPANVQPETPTRSGDVPKPSERGDLGF